MCCSLVSLALSSHGHHVSSSFFSPSPTQDKTFCKLQKKVPVYDMGLLQFKERVVRHPTIKTRLQQALLDNIRREREGELIDRQLMKHALLMLVEVNVYGRHVYAEDFEFEFLKTTQIFYKQESQEFLARNTVPDYLRKVQDRLHEEEARALDYLEAGTRKKLAAVVEQELITAYAEALVENSASGCRFMFQHNMHDDLRRMYQLFSRVPTTLDFVRALMGAHVRSLGDAIVQEQESVKNPMKFVQDVLDLRSKYSNTVEVAFQDAATHQADRNLSRALKDAFESFINRDSRVARHLCTYIDDMLRKSLKEVAESEINEKLEQVIVIFRYLTDKDVFEDQYKKHLSQRLLLGKSLSDDTERLMISKLRTECGHQFTTKLEAMFKDMTLSDQINDEFRASPLNPRAQRAEAVELAASVLTRGSWPLADAPQCVLPPSIAIACEAFKQFYGHRHSGRRLHWLTSHGSGELKCSFDKGKKELQVHTYQMCILVLYNSATSYTFQQIREMTSIPEAELRRHLLSLAHPKVKVLAKTPSTKEVHDDHTFAWNDAYTSPLYRVKIPLMALETAEEKAAAAGADADLPDSVLQSRQHSVDAAVVRIMKTRKTLEHNQLIIEVSKQLSHRFVTDASFIKKRIEGLIEKEYLERDQSDRRLYHYLA